MSTHLITTPLAIVAITGLALAPLASPARAGEGIAFVEAPEQGNGMCFADNPDEGFKCARKKCTENGTLAEDCYRVKWCYPAGWSADIFQQHQEGPHWHRYLCGWPDEAQLDQAIKLACSDMTGQQLIECAAVGKWSPQGKLIPLD